jgi:hypothetical protein
MYRPSQTPRLAVSSNQITREHETAPGEPHANANNADGANRLAINAGTASEYHSTCLVREYRDSRRLVSERRTRSA